VKCNKSHKPYHIKDNRDAEQLAFRRSQHSPYYLTMDMKASEVYVELISQTNLEPEGNGKALISIKAPRKWNDEDSSHLKLGVFFMKEKIAMKDFKFVDNHHSFQFSIVLEKTGKYKVSVTYYNEQVRHSPLYFEAYSDKIESRMSVDEPNHYKLNLRKTYEAIKSLSTSDNSYDHTTYQDNKKDVKVKIEGIEHLIQDSTSGNNVKIKSEESMAKVISNSQSDVSKIDYWSKDFSVSSSGDKGASRPIGICLLPSVGKFVVAATGENRVKMYHMESGKFYKEISSFNFKRPSDMVSLQNGNFVLRDRSNILMFDNDGNFLETIWSTETSVKSCYGLAENDENQLVCLMENKGIPILAFYDINLRKIIRKERMDMFIGDSRKSKCRFLTYTSGKYYITDNGCDQVYVLKEKDGKFVCQTVGKSGSRRGELCDPGGVVVDSAGNMIVVDSKNHRLCVFDRKGKYIQELKVSPSTSIRRPSGIYLHQTQRRMELYVLCLHGRDGVVKFTQGRVSQGRIKEENLR